MKNMVNTPVKIIVFAGILIFVIEFLFMVFLEDFLEDQWAINRVVVAVIDSMIVVILSLPVLYKKIKTSEKNLRQFREILDNSIDAIEIIDFKTTRYVDMSKAAHEALGYSIEEILSMSIKDIDPTFTDEVRQKLFSVIKEKGVLFFESTHRRKDGTVFLVEVTAKLINSTKPYVLAIVRDITERKKAESELLKLTSVVDQSPNSIIITDVDANIEYINTAFLKETGYSREEVIGQNPRILHSEKTPKATYDEMWAYLKQGKNWTGKLFNRRKDGSDYTELAIISPIRRADGKTINYLAVKQNITEEIEITKKAVASELRYRRLFESAKDGILILDYETGMIVDVNPFLIQILNYTKEEFLEKKVWELGIFKDIFANLEEFRKLQKEDYVRYEDLPLETAGGKIIHIEFISNVYLVEGEKVIQCNIRDITERHLMETVMEVGRLKLVQLNKDLVAEKKVAEEGKTRDDALLASLSEGMIATDDRGMITTVNRAAEDILGWRSSELVGRLLVDAIIAIDENDEIVTREKRLATMAIKEPDNGVWENIAEPTPKSFYYVHKNGERIPVAAIVTPVIVAGELVGVLETFRDTTIEKETEKTRGDLLALASHQLRTPLSGTKWLIETLQNGVKGPMSVEQKEYLDEIYKINERMTALVIEMLGVIRMEGDAVPVHRIPSSTKEIVNVIQETFGAAAKSNNITIHTEGLDYTVETDPLLLRNILESFVSNAITYSGSGSDIGISLEKKSSEVIFTVKDSGIGIPKNEQEHLFERFYRASNAKTFDTQGTGLGLYIAATLAKKIGATLSFESEEGKGSIFSVSIPYSERGGGIARDTP